MTPKTTRTAVAAPPGGAARPYPPSPVAAKGTPAGTGEGGVPVPAGSADREPGTGAEDRVRAPAAPPAAAHAAGEGGSNLLAEAMSEDDLERGLRDILKSLGLRLAYHPWKTHARRAKTGWPDWAIAGPGGLIFRELKRQREKPTRVQQEWLDALSAAGVSAGVWRPQQLLDGTIARELAALAGMRVQGGGGG